MGTSSSYRAPPTPRWNAFLAALSSGSSIDRIRSELFNAGDEWEEALASPAIASYAATLLRLFDELPARFTESQRPDLGLVAIAADARAASEAAGFSPGVAVAERALLRMVIAGVNGVHDSGTPAETIAHSWESSRGSDPNSLVARFVGELVSQFARHVVDREAGRLATEKLLQVDADVPVHRPVARDISAALAMAAEEVAHSVAIEYLATNRLDADSWATLLHRTFDRGRTLPAQAS